MNYLISDLYEGPPLCSFSFSLQDASLRLGLSILEYFQINSQKITGTIFTVMVLGLFAK